MDESHIMELTRMASQGDEDAQSLLGAYHLLEKNLDNAFAWLQQAAKQGVAEAQFKLALFYAYGMDRPVNKDIALRWVRSAAESGLPAAQCFLGGMYDRGDGVKQNDTTAFFWYEKAALAGDMDAQYALGLRYADGNGVEEDFLLGIHWIGCSASQKHLEAENLLAELQITPEYQRDYMLPLTTAANHGDPVAQWTLGHHYSHGRGVTKNLKTAFNWYEKSAQKNYPQGLFSLGECYAHGVGIFQDWEQAVFCYRKAAELQHSTAEFMLGRCYVMGLGGLEQSIPLALKWLEKSARAGDEDAKQLMEQLKDIKNM